MRWYHILIGILALDAGVAFAKSQGKVIPLEQNFINGKVGVQTPPSSPKTQGIQTFVRGDFLWWIAREDGLEYDLESTATLLGGAMPDIAVREPVFQWDPGFRVTLGGRIPEDFWEVKAEWTRLESAASGKIVATPGTLNNGVYIDTAGVVETANSTTLTSKWTLHYNLLNVGVSRGFFLGKNLSSEIAFGAVGLWIGQKFTIDSPYYQAALASYTTLKNQADVSAHFTNHYRAGGISFSAKPQWNFLRSWSVLASGTGYLVHGNFDIDQGWYVAQLNGNDLSLSKDYVRTRVGLQGALGLQWQSSTLNEDWHLSVSAQYEGMIWFKQNLWSQLNTLYAENYERRGDLELQGFSVSARLDF